MHFLSSNMHFMNSKINFWVQKISQTPKIHPPEKFTEPSRRPPGRIHPPGITMKCRVLKNVHFQGGFCPWSLVPSLVSFSGPCPCPWSLSLVLVPCPLSLVPGHWSTIKDQWAMISTQWSFIIDQWLLTRDKGPGTRHTRDQGLLTRDGPRNRCLLKRMCTCAHAFR